MRKTFEEYALDLAHVAATRSEDPYVKVGACALRLDRSVAAMGYNGAPPGIDIDWSDRDQRRPYVLHAETNCLRYCIPGEIDLIACTLEPCPECLKNIASYKIKRVVYAQPYHYDILHWPTSQEMARLFNIQLIKI